MRFGRSHLEVEKYRKLIFFQNSWYDLIASSISFNLLRGTKVARHLLRYTKTKEGAHDQRIALTDEKNLTRVSPEDPLKNYEKTDLCTFPSTTRLFLITYFDRF